MTSSRLFQATARFWLSALVAVLPACSGPEKQPSPTPRPVPTSSLPEHCQDQGPGPTETDIDCGGPQCAPCGAGRSCLRATDCLSGQCMRGSCQDPICANERKDSKETDVDCGGVRCRPCEAGKSCLESKDCASLVCVDGVCAEATCDDQVKNGAELDVDCGASGCFGCHPGTACTEPSQCASNLCEEGRCKVACPAGKAECDDNLGEECETRISNDPTHCGSCDNRCELANATQSCVDGACQIAACEAPYHDCNGEPKDGCEVNLDRDPDNCGGCDFVCSRVHADAACTDGNCAITCDFGFGDCDRDATNGCEMALGDSIEHCGGCNRRCTAPDEQTPVCIDGQCGVAP